VKEHPAFVDLPDAYSVLFPALQRLDPPDESRTTCHACPQAQIPGGPEDPDRRYLHDVRCCTYQPRLPNYLAGRALRRGGVGADRIRARIRREPEGVGVFGIHGTRAQAERYSAGTFGRDRELTCPFWVPGPLSCSIWRDRNSVCRTWHCRTTDGARSLAYWDTVRDALQVLELRLAAWLVRQVPEQDRPADGAGVEDWERYYISTTDRLLAATPAELGQIDMAEADGLALMLRIYQSMLHAPVPEQVVPIIAEIEDRGDNLALGGYSRLDMVTVPRSYMALYGLLLSGLPWREALEKAHEAGASFDAATIDLLWRRGLLSWVPGEEPREVIVYRELAAEHGLQLDDGARGAPPIAG
jgi:hypothetical protein